MNADKIAKISKKIATDYINAGSLVKSFEMTEEEWKKYSKLHPHAKKENHRVVPSSPLNIER